MHDHKICPGKICIDDKHLEITGCSEVVADCMILGIFEFIKMLKNGTKSAQAHSTFYAFIIYLEHISSQEIKKFTKEEMDMFLDVKNSFFKDKKYEQSANY